MIGHVEREGISLRHQLVVDVLDDRYDATMLWLGVMDVGLARFLGMGMALMVVRSGCQIDVSARRTHLVFQTEVLGSQRCGSNSPIRLLG